MNSSHLFMNSIAWPYQWIEMLAWSLVHFLWQGALIAIVVAAFLTCFRSARPTMRYAFCLVAFAVLAMCPVATFLCSNPVPTFWKKATGIQDTAASIDGQSGAEADPVIEFVASTSASSSCNGEQNDSPAKFDWPLSVNGQKRDKLIEAVNGPKRDADPERVRGAADVKPSLMSKGIVAWVPPGIVGVWVVGVTLCGLRLLLGWVGVWRLRNRTVAVPEWIVARTKQLSETMNIAQPLIRSSQRVGEAIAVGFIKPMILLPVSWQTELPPDMLETIIAHELAHIRRGDLWVNLFQRLIEMLLFYHPVVWWLSARIRTERELCCDAMVVEITNSPLRYAETLERVGRLGLESNSRHQSSSRTLVVASVGSRNALLNRIRAILETPDRATPTLAATALLAGVIGLTTVLFVFGFALTTKATAVSSEVDDSRLIVPGKRVGEYRIGVTTFADVFGDDRPFAENVKKQEMKKRGLEFSFNQGREIKEVTVSNPEFETAEGVRVGTATAELRERYPDLQQINGGSEKIRLQYFVSPTQPDIHYFLHDERVAAIRVAVDTGDEHNLDDQNASDSSSPAQPGDDDIEINWTPVKGLFLQGESVVLSMKLKNVCDTPIWFVDGESYLAFANGFGRNTQFEFVAMSDAGSGQAVPDRGMPDLPVTGRRMPVTLQPGEVFEMRVALDSWFTLSEPGIYRIDGSYTIRDPGPNVKPPLVPWEKAKKKVAKGSCLVHIRARDNEFFPPDPWPELGIVRNAGRGWHFLRIAGHKAAATDLGLSADQQRHCKELFDQYLGIDRDIEARLRKEHGSLPAKLWESERGASWVEGERAATKQLTPGQVKRINQFMLRRHSFHAFLMPEVQTELDLTDDQLAEIRALIKLHYQRRGRESLRQTGVEIEKLLSDQQRRQFAEMRGLEGNQGSLSFGQIAKTLSRLVPQGWTVVAGENTITIKRNQETLILPHFGLRAKSEDETEAEYHEDMGARIALDVRLRFNQRLSEADWQTLSGEYANLLEKGKNGFRGKQEWSDHANLIEKFRLPDYETSTHCIFQSPVATYFQILDKDVDKEMSNVLEVIKRLLPANRGIVQEPGRPSIRWPRVWIDVDGIGMEYVNASHAERLKPEDAVKFFSNDAESGFLQPEWASKLDWSSIPDFDAWTRSKPNLAGVAMKPRNVSPHARIVRFSKRQVELKVVRPVGSYLWHQYFGVARHFRIERTDDVDRIFGISQLERKHLTTHKGIGKLDSVAEVQKALGKPDYTRSLQNGDWVDYFFADDVVIFFRNRHVDTVTFGGTEVFRDEVSKSALAKTGLDEDAPSSVFTGEVTEDPPIVEPLERSSPRPPETTEKVAPRIEQKDQGEGTGIYKIISGKEHVRWIRQLDIEGAESGAVQAAIESDGRYLLAGKKWNRASNKEKLWVWQVNGSGDPVWKRDLATQDRTEEMNIVGFLPIRQNPAAASLMRGCRIVYLQGVTTRLATIDADGIVSASTDFPWNDHTDGVVELDDGDLLLFGSTMLDINKKMGGWVARTDSRGRTVRWKRDYYPEEIKSGETDGRGEPKSKPGFFEHTMFGSSITLADQSIVLIGQTGVYSKFGVGQSRLWLLRIDASGKRLGEAFVADAYFGRTMGNPVVTEAGKLIVAHWKFTKNGDKLTVNDRDAPATAYWPWFSRFDQQLHALGDGDTMAALFPNALTVGHSYPAMFPLHSMHPLLIRWADRRGDVTQKVEIGGGQVTPASTLANDDEVLSISNWMSSAGKDERGPKVLLVSMKPPE